FATGPVPLPRYDATMILDRDDELVLFGGDGSAYADSDVWVLPLGSDPLRWQELDGLHVGQGPGPRARHGAAYSASANRMVVFGGEAKVYAPLLDRYGYETRPPRAWVLSLDGAKHWLPTVFDPAAPAPVAEIGGALVPDATGRFAVLIPGQQD